jgi:hypothetical protein
VDRQKLRTWGPGLVAAALCVAALQVGVARLLQSGREASLARQLAEQRLESHRRELRLTKELRSARLRSQRLRTTLARARALGASLRMELAAARADVLRLQSRAQTASETLRNEPPPLGLRIAATEPLEALLAVADNAGSQAIRIAEAQGRLWIGARPDPVGLGRADLAVEPGEEVDFYEFPLQLGESMRVASGALALRGALCVVYSRESDAAATPWAREVWFEYRPELGETAVLGEDRWAPWPGEVACDLESAPAPG